MTIVCYFLPSGRLSGQSRRDPRRSAATRAQRVSSVGRCRSSKHECTHPFAPPSLLPLRPDRGVGQVMRRGPLHRWVTTKLPAVPHSTKTRSLRRETWSKGVTRPASIWNGRIAGAAVPVREPHLSERARGFPSQARCSTEESRCGDGAVSGRTVGLASERRSPTVGAHGHSTRPVQDRRPIERGPHLRVACTRTGLPRTGTSKPDPSRALEVSASPSAYRSTAPRRSTGSPTTCARPALKGRLGRHAE